MVNLIIWIGCDIDLIKKNNTPTAPILKYPGNNAVEIKLDTTLNWNFSNDEDGDALHYNVYFDIVNPPIKKISELQSGISFKLSLKSNTTYYWKVEVDDGNGKVSVSEVWNFKTIVPPSVPIITSPTNNSTNVNLNTDLKWSASTSTSGYEIKYDIYFGISSTPTIKVNNLQIETSFTTFLLSNTTYFWKIIAVDGNGLVSESEVSTFKTKIVPPTAPVLTFPINGATNISLSSILTWKASISYSSKDIKYNVYLGTANIPTTTVSSLQTGISFTPTLLLNTTYFWKIVADDGNEGVTESEIRSFTTVK